MNAERGDEWKELLEGPKAGLLAVPILACIPFPSSSSVLVSNPGLLLGHPVISLFLTPLTLTL